MEIAMKKQCLILYLFVLFTHRCLTNGIVCVSIIQVRGLARNKTRFNPPISQRSVSVKLKIDRKF